ncbi:MAG: TetR family transcriptional regulator [Burkholderiales bacterium]|nr:TetR family transcriptional regulator [Burkholderiales bacterium]
MRRTKEEAEQTRRRIMYAALQTFHRRGIARTTLEQVARAARVTRGAIYWHFSGKQALLRAIRDDVSLPLVDQSDFTLLDTRAAEPLARIERFLCNLLDAVAQDEHTRLLFAVMSFRCEYVGELAPELDEFVRKNQRLNSILTRVYRQAQRQGAGLAGLSPRLAALDTLVFLAGLLRLWLLDERAQLGMRSAARPLIAAHVGGRRAALRARASVPVRARGRRGPMAHGRSR